MMVRTVILILMCVCRRLVEGLDSNSMGNQNRTTRNQNKRILYGERADESKFRYMVFMRYAADECAGTIISHYWILTVADCLIGINCDDIEIYPLAWSIRERLSPSDCSYHPNAVRRYTNYNIGLMKVSPSLLEDKRATRALLPNVGQRFPKGTAALFPGWGLNENHEDVPFLHLANVRLDEWALCDNAYKPWDVNEDCSGLKGCEVAHLAARVICAQGEGPVLPSPCSGDLGSPLIVGDTVIGVLSHIIKEDDYCAFDAPFISTSVVDYLPWIYNHIFPDLDTRKIPVRPEYDIRTGSLEIR